MTTICTSRYWDGEPMKTAPNPDKEALLAFLGKFPFVAAAAGHFTDAVTGEEVGEDWLSYEAGGYSWDSSDVYHFDKYDLELTPEFCQYALAR